MKQLANREQLATYGVPQGCQDGCCNFRWQLVSEGPHCHIQFPYQACLTNGSSCNLALPAQCCSGNCTQDEEPLPTCKPTGPPHPPAGIKVADWVPRCDLSFNFECFQIDQLLKSVLGT